MAILQIFYPVFRSSKMKTIFPNIFLSLTMLLCLADFLVYKGLHWGGFIYLFVAAMLLLQLKYKVKYADQVLGVLLFCWNSWMVLALLSDVVKDEATAGYIIFAAWFPVGVVASWWLLSKPNTKALPVSANK
jgi:hypothetical protein